MTYTCELDNLGPMETQENILSLTPKEKIVLEFIEEYVEGKGLAPTFLEIKDHFNFASFNSVQRYLKQLQKKEYIHMPGGNQKRALSILKTSNSVLKILRKNQDGFAPNQNVAKETSPVRVPPLAESLSLPLLGKVAAGKPIEASLHDSYVDVPASLVPAPNNSFALTVKGDSMIDDGIHDGDTILVQKQSHAHNGEIVVALIENEATVKRFYFDKSQRESIPSIMDDESNFEFSMENVPQVELRPSNSSMSTMWFAADQVKIEGIVVGLIRKF